MVGHFVFSSARQSYSRHCTYVHACARDVRGRAPLFYLSFSLDLLPFCHYRFVIHSLRYDTEERIATGRS